MTTMATMMATTMVTTMTADDEDNEVEQKPRV
jgi:hypothetical protein